MYNGRIPAAEYREFAKRFNPVKYDADAWVRMAKDAGMKYIVITSKHHDGFAIWRSEASKWNIGDATPYGRQSGRDPLKELADACHATKTNGSPWEIKLCFYHSHCADWAEEDASQIGYLDRKEPTPEVFQHYLDRKVKPQLTELLTHYGEVGMIWFDVPRVITVEQVQQLKDLVHKLSPSGTAGIVLANGSMNSNTSGEGEIRKNMIDAGLVVVAVGGGGIPVIDMGDGQYAGTAAVIDKDFASSLLAQAVNADLFLISTAVEKVAINFGKPDQLWLDRLTLSEAKVRGV